MEEIIRAVAEKVGLDEETAQSVVGTLLSFVRDAADEEDANALLDQLPGAQELVDGAGGESEGGGGLMGMLGGMLGGSLGSAMSAFSQLQEKGLDMDQIGEAGKTLFGQLSEQLDSDLVRRVVANVAGNIPGVGGYLSDFLDGDDDA